MNQGKQHEDQAIDAHTRNEEQREKAKETYVYKWSGIFERQGYTPYWLIIAWVVVMVWGIYYLWAYWAPPPQ